MKSICTVILALSMGALGSVSALAQTGNTNYGTDSLFRNTTGSDDTAIGSNALQDNTTGSYNTATGYVSLLSNTTGDYNSAFGSLALIGNTSGNGNVAFGYSALVSETTGGSNTAVGQTALQLITTGTSNIGIGYLAGSQLADNTDDNIDIGNIGTSTDSGVIRIGTSGSQSAFFASGVRGVKTGLSNAVEVMIDGNGQLGTVNSSIRFKEDVQDMAAASDGLMKLRPVTYRYKQPYADGSRPVDYGLIAEDVAKVYPDLVARDASGQIQTVQYQKLTPMLLNEVQKQHKQLEEQQQIIERQQASVQQQAETIQQLKTQLAALPLLEKRLAALEAVQPSASRLEAALVTK